MSWSKPPRSTVSLSNLEKNQVADIIGVKNCAIVSSFAAVGDCVKPFAEQKGRVYTEDDWLPQTEEDCEKAEKDEK
jgi:hypothetical protein